jgi:hypothetical protein
MFGQMLFAELPFATIGQPPHIERGWIKDCADKGKCSDWIKQPKNDVDTIDCGYVPTNWSRVK